MVAPAVAATVVAPAVSMPHGAALLQQHDPEFSLPVSHEVSQAVSHEVAHEVLHELSLKEVVLLVVDHQVD